MCYPPPGPRCSNHSHAEWLKAVAALERETDTNKRIILQIRVDEALRNFNATPRGQNRLLREMGAIANDPEQKDELVKLSLQLRDGQLTRKNQLDAFRAMKNSKGNTIKELLKTTNKQEQAVGIAFHVLMGFLPETQVDTFHIIDKTHILAGQTTILCLPQTHQRVFATIAEEEDGYLSSSELPTELLDIFADFPQVNTITPNHIIPLGEWFIRHLKEQGVMFLASVDVKTENVVFDTIDNLWKYYTPSFKQARKLGGTAPYIHGETDLLKEAIKDSPLETSDITVATVKDQKRTYIIDAPVITPNEIDSPYFYFAPRTTADGSHFYEVRTKHQSSKSEIIIKLSRNMLVIPRTDENTVKKFIFDHFPVMESSEKS